MLALSIHGDCTMTTDFMCVKGEFDRILDSADQPSYGAVDDDGIGQIDEEELRREREALEHITAHAAEYGTLQAPKERRF